MRIGEGYGTWETTLRTEMECGRRRSGKMWLRGLGASNGCDLWLCVGKVGDVCLLKSWGGQYNGQDAWQGPWVVSVSWPICKNMLLVVFSMKKIGLEVRGFLG